MPLANAAVGMDDWFLPVPERGARVGGHAVGQCRVRAGADRPRDRKPVVAVDHGRQIGLARGNRELREVRDPQHVRTLGVEVAVHQIRRRLGQLTLVRAVPLRAPEQGRQAMPGRQPHDPFRRYPDAHALQLQVDPLVPVPALAVLERLLDQGQQPRVLVRSVHGLDLVVVCAARDADHGQQASGGHAELLTGLFDEDGLLSVGQVFRDCARLFSQQLDHALPDRDLDVQFPLLPPLPLDVGIQPVQTGLHLRQPLLQRRHRVRQAGRVPRAGGGRRHGRRRRGLHAGFPLPGRRGLLSRCLRHVRLLGSGEHLPFPVSRRRTPPRPVRRPPRVISAVRTRPRPPPSASIPREPGRAPACVGRGRARRSTR